MTNLNIPFRQDESPEEDSIVIENPNNIQKNIEELYEKKAPLTISIIGENNNSQYHTKICQIDNECGKLILHKPTPQFKQHQECMVNISAPLPSGLVIFSSILSPEEGEEKSIDPMYFQANVPKKIYKKQQRNYFRVSLVPYNAAFKFNLEANQEPFSFSGNCLDISLGGMCGMLENDSLIALTSANTDISANSRITIPELLDIKVPCTIRRLKINDQLKCIAGIEFCDLSEQQTNAIEKAISYIERQHIRHFKK